MSTTLSDQFVAASKRFDQARIAFEKELAGLKELEQGLLNYTGRYEDFPKAGYIGHGIWQAHDGTISAVKCDSGDNSWWYFTAPYGQDGYTLGTLSEAKCFLFGYKIATKNARNKAIADEQEAAASRMTQPE